MSEKIVSRPFTNQGRDNYDAIFGLAPEPERLEEYKYVILEDGASEGYDFKTGRRAFFKPNDAYMHGVEEVFPEVYTGTRVVGGDYPDCVPQAVRKKMYELKHGNQEPT